jgi:predicted GIY-YIG superfamily endonuclease
MKKLYLIQSSEGYIKIGVSGDPAKRLQYLQRYGHKYGCISGKPELKLLRVFDLFFATEAESMLKHKFKAYKVLSPYDTKDKSGEWFQINLELILVALEPRLTNPIDIITKMWYASRVE